MRTERGGERAFFHALAALLFAALCAWLAAALYGRLAAPAPVPVETPEEQTAAAPGRFRGVLLRRETRLAVGSFPGTASGARLSAMETGTESALYYPDCDGWEAALTPEDAQSLTPERLEALLDRADGENHIDAPRLVYGFTLMLAALYDGEAAPAPGPVSLTAEGIGAFRASLLSVTEDAMGRRMLVLRLTDFPEELYETRFIEGEIW